MNLMSLIFVILMNNEYVRHIMARVNFSQIMNIYFSGFCDEDKVERDTEKFKKLAKRCAIKAARLEKKCELPLMSSNETFMIGDGISCTVEDAVQKAECEFFVQF